MDHAVMDIQNSDDNVILTPSTIRLDIKRA